LSQNGYTNIISQINIIDLIQTGLGILY